MTSPDELRDRTKKFALRVIKLYRSLPNSGEAQVIGKQLLRSGTAIGANYRAACRARSRAEFISKLGVVVEEADESIYWIELLAESSAVSSNRLKDLEAEAHELTAIFTAARQTSKS
jgi:four helix bundle protein